MNTKKLSVSQKKLQTLTGVWKGEKHVMNCRNGSYMSVRPTGDKIWYRNGKFHRDDDLPAVIYFNGTKMWYQNGKFHRNNGPAAIYPAGTKMWYQNGKLHRNDGPAVIYPDGYEMWYQNGKHCRDK